MINYIKKAIFGLPPIEATFEKRRFKPTTEVVQQHLVKIVEVFLDGYNRAIVTPNLDKLVADLEKKYDNHFVGFAFEGTGMYLAMQDVMMPWGKNRLQSYMANQGAKHHYIILVGAGFVYARLPWGFRVLENYMRTLDPTLAWILPDGAGFHQGIFFHEKYITNCAPHPSHLPKYSHEPYDSGIGRAMWWVKGANPQKIRAAIDEFPKERQAFLWHGIGTACAYAGGVNAESLRELKALSGEYVYHFLSGVPLSTIMRQEGGNPSKWTDLACEVLFNQSPKVVSDMMMKCREEELATWNDETEGMEVFVENTTKRMIAELKKVTELQPK